MNQTNCFIYCSHCCTSVHPGLKFCPSCKSRLEESADENLTKILLNATALKLKEIVPNLEDLVDLLPEGNLLTLLRTIVEQSELINLQGTGSSQMKSDVAVIDQADVVKKLICLRPQFPTEAVVAIVFELLLQLHESDHQIHDLLESPPLLALGLTKSRLDEEIEIRISQGYKQPLTFTPIKIPKTAEKSYFKRVVLYLATREAIAGGDWKNAFKSSLKSGDLAEIEVEENAHHWKQLLKEGETPDRPGSPWQERLKENGNQNLKIDPSSFVVASQIALVSKEYTLAEDIAKAALRLIDEVSEFDGLATDTSKEALSLNCRIVVAACAEKTNSEEEQRKSRDQLTTSLHDLAGSLIPNMDSNIKPILDAAAPFTDMAMQIAMAESAMQQNDLDAAEVKYNAIVFNCRELTAIRVENVEKQDPASFSMESIRALMGPASSLFLLKAYVRLGELKIRREQLQLADSYFRLAEKVINEMRSESPDLFNHEATKVQFEVHEAVIMANIAKIALSQNQRGTALRLFKNSFQILKGLSPKNFAGYDMDFEGISKNFACLLKDLGQNEKAEEVLEQIS